MKIGLLSDSHGDLQITRRAVSKLREGGAEYLIHCGDVGGRAVLEAMMVLPTAFVLGNTDYNRAALLEVARNGSMNADASMVRLLLDGRNLAVTHGDDEKLLRRLIDSQEYDFVFHGHTHKQRDERIGRTHVVNPGALHRAAIKTVALIDLGGDEVEFLNIQRPSA